MRIKDRLLLLASLLATTASQIHPTLAKSEVHADLQSQWSSLVMHSPGLVHATVSAYALDLTTGHPLAAQNPDLRQTPASVTKLITSAAALDTLGSAFRYSTKVAIMPHPVSGKSPIYLIGGGDPLLEANNTGALETMAKQVARSVKSATQVVGVSSLYPGPDVGPGWALNDIAADYGAGTDALMAQRSEIIVRVRATKVGQMPRLQLMFNSAVGVPDYFHLVNHAVTVAAGHPEELSAFRDLGTNTLSVQGTIPAGTWKDEFLSIGSPPQYAATLFEQLLKQDGVRFSGTAVTGLLPGGTKTIVNHVSEPLAQSLKLQNQFSINQMAENLYRMVGVRADGSGSPSGANTAMDRFLKRTGVNLSDLQMVDGSGVSSLDDMSARQVVQVLHYAAGRPWFDVYEHSLMKLNSTSDAGILAGHPFRLPVGTAVWLKTGNLSNQWNYAGYVDLPNGHRIAFAILDDGPTTKSLAGVGSPIDQMVEAIANSPMPPAHALVGTVTTSGSLNALSALPPQLGFMSAKLNALGMTDGLVGVSVVNAATGKVVWSVNGDKILPCGSLPRVAVADAALTRYGDSRFGALTLCVQGTVRDGTLYGSITLAGHGNPALTKGDLMRLAVRVKSAGIRHIRTSIRYVDANNPLPWPLAMPWNDMGQAFAPPWSGLSVDGDVVTLAVTVGKNQRSTIRVEPSDTPIRVVNQVSVTNTTDGRATVTYDASRDAYVVTGQVSSAYSLLLPIAPKNAGEVAAVAFRDALRTVGISTPATVVPVAADVAANRRLAQGPGPTVDEVATNVLHQASSSSVNALFHLLGTPDRADKVVQNLLGSEASLQDPTALSAENYASADSFATLLATMSHQQRAKSVTAALKYHLWQSSAPEVRTVAGYLRAPSGTLYAIVIINSNRRWTGSFAPSIDG